MQWAIPNGNTNQQEWRVTAMRTRLIVVVTILSVSGLILAAQLGAFEADEARTIPVNTAYATFQQDGLKSLDEAVDSDVLSMIQEAPQQIVLCIGSDVAAAVKASAASFSMPEDPVPAVGGGANDTLWVAAYLGSEGSIPPAYRVRSIEVKGKTIRVAYERDDAPVRSCDLRAYMVWAPVGPGEAGAYTLELFDVVAERITLTRPWQVTVK
jgi:hypothetical protein